MSASSRVSPTPTPPRRFSGAAAAGARIRLPMRVWDLPTRLFHWLVVLLIALSYVSINLADDSVTWMRIHLLSGYAMLTLLLFRLVWGFAGSDTARFRQFVRSPIAGLRHLRDFRARTPDDQVGHNEAGGWMVLGLLASLGVQVVSGLFSNSDGGPEGPLAHLVSQRTSDLLSTVHAISFKVLLGFMAVHVVAIILYAVVKGHRLIWPMITGKKRLPAATRAPRMASLTLAALVLVCATAAVLVLVRFA